MIQGRNRPGETGGRGRLYWNQDQFLTDKVIINKLVEASQAGVKIEMVVRGICCLIPEIKGYTENIKVLCCRPLSGAFQNLPFRYKRKRKNIYCIC